MIVNVSTKKQTELDRMVKALRENYRRAMRTNELHPGMIRKPAAWALYRTWREFDVRGEKGGDAGWLSGRSSSPRS